MGYCFLKKHVCKMGKLLMEKTVAQKLEKFFAGSKPLRYKKKEIILRPNEKILSLYLLKHGRVRMYAVNNQGDEFTIHIFQPPAVFPLMLALTNKYSEYYLETSTAVQVYSESVENVIKFIKSQPNILFELTTRFAKGLNGLSFRLSQLAYEQKYIKTVALLNYLVQNFGIRNEDEEEVILPLGHKEIASWLGTSRETVTRFMSKLQNKKLIRQQNSELIVTNAYKLEREAREELEAKVKRSIKNVFKN